MSTIPTIQFLRNNNIYSSRDAARSALEGQKVNVPDGGVILARYSGTTGEQMIIKTLAGFVSNISTPQNATVTIIDVEGAINNISGETAGEEGKFISAITQTNGVITARLGGVAAANVSVADEGNIFTATTVEGVLSEIKNSLDNAIGTGGTVEEQISDAINALDSEESGTSTSNHITVGVKQVDGKITSVTVSDSDIASAALLGTKEDASTAQTAFGYIAKEVADRTAAINALSTSSTVTLESAEGTESGVLKVYTIKQGDREVGTINIPKDLVVTSGSVVKGTWDGNTFTEDVSGNGTALKLVIANQEAPVYINTLDLVKDHTAGNGIAISDTNVISVQIAEGSEEFLSVSESGVKLSGVQAAISEASGHVNTIIDARLGTGVTSDSTATAQFAELSDKLGTGITTVATVTEQLKALSGSSTSDTSNTISVIGAKKYTDAKVEALDFGPVGGTGKVITAISQENGLVSASTIELTASNVQATPFVSGDTKVAVDGATVSAQIESLATSIKSVSTAAAAAHTVVNEKNDGHVKVTVSSENSHAVVTITENDIASADKLAAETTNRQTQDDKIEESIGLDAEGNHKKTTGNYTNGATTVVGEIAALDTQLKAVSDTLGTGVSTAEGKTVTEQLQALSGRTGDASGITSVEGAKAYAKDLVDNLGAEVESKIKSETEITTTKAIKIVQTNGKIASITLGAFDCGTY